MNKKMLLLFLSLLNLNFAQTTNASCNTCDTVCNTNLICDETICSCLCSGKTYFANRPLFQSYRPEYLAGFRNDRMMAKEECAITTENSKCWGGALDVVLYGGQSINSKNLASYFLPFCKNGLVVTESVGTIGGQPTGDILSEHFNIYTIGGSSTPSGFSPFESNVAFFAKHAEFGLGFHWKQMFWYNDREDQWFYFDVSLPITQVRNQICIREDVLSNGGGINTNTATGGSPNAVPNMTAAFNQSAWNFGKINSGCVMKKTGVADMEFKVAYQWLWEPTCNAAGYVGVLIPTGNTPMADFVFEPIVGHGGHAGFEFGGQGGFDIWSDCDRFKYVSFDLALNALYLFKRTQRRSFDLKNKPWSRYQDVYANEAQAKQASELVGNNGISLSTPGINIFTQCVNVTPGLIVNGTAALIVSAEDAFLGEVGYNFYAHHKECVTLAHPWQTGPALKAIDGAGKTNPVRNITPNAQLNDTGIDVPFADYTSSLIQETDLDLDSAAHPYYFSHMIYGALGTRWYDICIPTDVNLGASYEFARKEFAAMNRWTLWGKVGISF